MFDRGCAQAGIVVPLDDANCFDRMDRMTTMIASALGSLPNRPESNEKNGLWDSSIPSGSSLYSLGRLGAEPRTERRIFLILPILPILLGQLQFA